MAKSKKISNNILIDSFLRKEDTKKLFLEKEERCKAIVYLAYLNKGSIHTKAVKIFLKLDEIHYYIKALENFNLIVYKDKEIITITKDCIYIIEELNRYKIRKRNIETKRSCEYNSIQLLNVLYESNIYTTKQLEEIIKFKYDKEQFNILLKKKRENFTFCNQMLDYRLIRLDKNKIYARIDSKTNKEQIRKIMHWLQDMRTEKSDIFENDITIYFDEVIKFNDELAETIDLINISYNFKIKYVKKDIREAYRKSYMITNIVNGEKAIKTINNHYLKTCVISENREIDLALNSFSFFVDIDINIFGKPILVLFLTHDCFIKNGIMLTDVDCLELCLEQLAKEYIVVKIDSLDRNYREETIIKSIAPIFAEIEDEDELFNEYIRTALDMLGLKSCKFKYTTPNGQEKETVYTKNKEKLFFINKDIESVNKLKKYAIKDFHRFNFYYINKKNYIEVLNNIKKEI